jgi:hypothetical protein
MREGVLTIKKRRIDLGGGIVGEGVKTERGYIN